MWSFLLRSIPNLTGDGLGEEVGRIKRTGTILETVQDAYNLARRMHGYWQNKTRWTVSISSDDRLYDAALKWFLSDEADTKPPRALKATYVYGERGRRSRAAYLDDLDSSDVRPRREAGRVELVFNETSVRTVNIRGHKIAVHLQRSDHSIGGDEDKPYRPLQPDTLNFYCRSRDGQTAIIEHLRQIAADADKRKPALHLLNTWGGWSRRDDLPTRQLDSVVLRAGQMESIRDDIRAFLDQEAEYARRGMPYHRGYMLYGPPGTGKTSIVRALAAHFGLDLWYAPLGDLEKDTSLIALINQVQPGSILLLEDVDVYHATRERDDEQRGTSMAGLLNALDGVGTPHGLITFMTTNDIDVIDKALLRPGRIDVVEEIGHPDQDQVARLFESWYDSSLTPGQVERIEWSGTTADLTELFKQNLNDSDAAWRALQKKTARAEKRSVKANPSSGGKR
ncbi:MAG TPA: AAA family ATPase [Acidimicrobiales bacterium]|nr:AAA family ATPase [Acidimicrobiales bacterium]